MAKLAFKILNKAKKKELLNELAQYGIQKLPYLVIKWGKRLRIFSGNMSKEMISSLVKELNVDSIGLYFASMEEGFRVHIDSLHLLASQVRQGTLDIDEKQAQDWFEGKNIDLDDDQKNEMEKFKGKFIILRNNGDLVGVGKRSVYGINNFMPKERRIKTRTIS